MKLITQVVKDLANRVSCSFFLLTGYLTRRYCDAINQSQTSSPGISNKNTKISRSEITLTNRVTGFGNKECFFKNVSIEWMA